MANTNDDTRTGASSPSNEQGGQQGGQQGAQGNTREGRTIGRGMTSPDSTQVPLRADTGEPDEEAIRGFGGDRDKNTRNTK